MRLQGRLAGDLGSGFCQCMMGRYLGMWYKDDSGYEWAIRTMSIKLALVAFNLEDSTQGGYFLKNV